MGGGDLPAGRHAADGTAITPKYVGPRRLIEVAVATLATDRALLLLGVPGTAKTWVSRAPGRRRSPATRPCSSRAPPAPPRRRSGTAGTTPGCSPRAPRDAALVPRPVMRRCETGGLARIEELTRMPSDVQDALITVLSEKTLPIPELGTRGPGAQGLQRDRHRQRPRPRRQRAVVARCGAGSTPWCCRCRPTPRTRSSIVSRRVAELGRALELPEVPHRRGRDPPGGHRLPRAARRA